MTSTKRQAPIAKITRPRQTNVLPRERLFSLLDGESRYPVVWLVGPAGAGKTTLVASYLDARKIPSLWYQVDAGDSDIATFFYYMGKAARGAAPRKKKPLPLLTPEYMLGVPTFTRRFFEELFSRLRPPYAVVFDNYQEAQSPAFHEVIANGLDVLPEGIRVFLISRTDPVPQMSRFIAGSGLQLIGWDDLRFTETESGEFIRKRLGNAFPRGSETRLYRETKGWAAGLVLFLETMKRDLLSLDHLPRISELSSSAVFDYFSTEIFERTDPETQMVLLKTSLLPVMTVSLATALSGADRAGRILSGLGRSHYFIELHPGSEITFQYHPLFREFLLSRAHMRFDPEELIQLKKQAGVMLEERDRIESAVDLYIDSRDWESLARLVLNHAGSLIAAGRSQTLMMWLSALPMDLLESSPWLLYWSGMCRMGYDLVGARRGLEKALKIFMGINDHRGMALSWSSLIDAYLTEWNDFHPLDDLITSFFEKVEKTIHANTPEIQLRAVNGIGLALFIRRPDHPRVAEFIERAVSLARDNYAVSTRLPALITANIYYSWVGNFLSCDALLEEIKRTVPSSQTSTPERILSDVMLAGRHLWDVSSAEEAEKIISEGLELGAETGVRCWEHMFYALGIYCSLMTEDMPRAEEYLDKMKGMLIQSRREIDVAYHMMNCLYQFLKGNFYKSLRSAETGLEFDEKTGYIFPRIVQLHGMSQVLHALRDNRADEYLERAFDLSVLSKSAILEFECRLARAQFAFDNGKEEIGIGLLREALALGNKQGYFQLLWWWDRTAMSRLAVKALEYGIETDYVLDLIRIRKLSPEEPPVHLENWPWPVKVHTLGGFSLERDGTPVRSTGKVQQKPLAMLKAIIAFGGKEVSDEQLIDALWPEADGDVANLSFRTTLHRLRQLISKGAIELKEGRLTLDPRYCWVDAWAFQSLTEKAEALWKECKDNHKITADENGITEFIKVSEKAMNMYRGEFLPGDHKQSWTISMRERLKGKFIRLIGRLGNYYEQAGQWEHVVECYQKALEVDDLQEEFYRRLMLSHHKIGRHFEALAIYNRCRNILSSVLGIEPSPETEAVRKNIRASK